MARKPKPSVATNSLEKRLFATIKARKLSMLAAAKALGVHVNSLANWKGGMPASPESATKIRRFLGRRAA